MQHPARDLLTNVGGTVNVREAARAFNVGRLVFASTGGAIYGHDLVRLLGEIHGDGTAKPNFKPARPGEVERSCLDASRARDVLGWQASTSIKKGLRRTYAAALH